MVRIARLLGRWAGIAGAEEGRAMDDVVIAAALTDRTLIYEAGWPHFYASGRTLHKAGCASGGYWTARDGAYYGAYYGAYCSQWPPSDGLEQGGDALRFVGANGDITEGRYAD